MTRRFEGPNHATTIGVEAMEMAIGILVKSLANINPSSSDCWRGKDLNRCIILPKVNPTICIKAVDRASAGKERTLCRSNIDLSPHDRRRGGKIYDNTAFSFE